MGIDMRKLKSIVAATGLLVSVLITPATASDGRLDDLFDSLRSAPAEDAPAFAAKLTEEWAKSGSPAMDLLLRRGKAALDAEDLPEAINHLTALTDHAPEFAEGWHTLALAYYQSGQIGPAMDVIERTLALEPRHYPAMVGLMAILDDAGFTEHALNVAEMIEAIHPHHPQLSSFKSRLEAQTKGRDL